MSEKRGLGPKAFEPVPEGEEYKPFVSADETPREFTFQSVGAGILFGILFGAANAYLGLRAGLTISTSIPVAVMTVALFRALGALGHKGTILEANMSQTVGSASSSVASGVIFTLPALFLWHMDPSLLQMTLLALSGGLLGVLFMIPLRRFLIEREHGRLPYPEGTACAQVLVASEVGGGKAGPVFAGLAMGAVFKLIAGWIRIIPSKIHFDVPFLPKAQLGSSLSAALLGVGFILGPRIGTIMVGGGLLSWLVIIPLIAVWGAGRAEPLYPETVQLITDMDPHLIWHRYVRYIGAGAVATAGLFTLIRSIPTMIESFRIGASNLKRRIGKGSDEAGARTKKDLPLSVVGGGALILFLVMVAVPQIFGTIPTVWGRAIAALLVVVFAFFFVTVASRIVGLVGVTSNPTSGMTIASLLATSTIFLALGWTGDAGKVAALCVGCVIAIAASIAGDTSQDLKTGFLLGATPKKQQIGELAGVITSATFVCLAVLLLDRAYGFGTDELPAPQATLMKLVIEGVLQSSLPWVFVGIGVLIAIVVELLRIPSLPFAVGVYLPVTTMVPVFLGGIMRMAVERFSKTETDKGDRRERGILFGSGLVGGEGLLGVAIAAVAFARGSAPAGIGPDWAGSFAPLVGAAAFFLLGWLLWKTCTSAKGEE